MPEDGQVAGNTGSPLMGSGGADGQAGSAGSFDWKGYRSTLGDVGKEKSLDPIFNSDNPGSNLVKGYVDAQKLIGSSIRMPAKDAKPEDRKKFSDEIVGKLRSEGLLEAPPESAEKYEFKFPQEVQVNEPLVNSFRSIAHKLALPQSQANSLVDWYLEVQHEADLQNGQAMVEARDELKKGWGPLYGRKHELARRAAAHFIGDDAEQVFADLPASAGKRIVQAFAAIGEKLAEHEIISGEIPGGQSLEQIRAKIAAIQKDKNGPAFDTSKPGHAEAKKELQGLIDLFTRLGGKWGEK